MKLKSPKAKGNAYELAVAKLFRELGYTACVSSRSESKRTDDEKIDLCYTGPFQVQCKANERLGSTHAILASMPNRSGKYNLVFHKKSRQGSVVSMTAEDFLAIVKLLIRYKAIKPEC